MGKGNRDDYRRVLRMWLALRMETRRGTEESPRGLCEMSSSTEERERRGTKEQHDEEREQRKEKERKGKK